MSGSTCEDGIFVANDGKCQRRACAALTEPIRLNTPAREMPRHAGTKPSAVIASRAIGLRTRRTAMPAARFEIAKDKAGKYRFHLKAGNGEIIVASQAYVRKANAQKGIRAVKAAVDAAIVDLTEESVKK